MTICHWNGTSSLPLNTNLIEIPAGYRPTGELIRQGYGMRYNNGSRLTQPCNMRILANGMIQQAGASDFVSLFLVADWPTS